MSKEQRRLEPKRYLRKQLLGEIREMISPRSETQFFHYSTSEQNQETLLYFLELPKRQEAGRFMKIIICQSKPISGESDKKRLIENHFYIKIEQNQKSIEIFNGRRKRKKTSKKELLFLRNCLKTTETKEELPKGVAIILNEEVPMEKRKDFFNQLYEYLRERKNSPLLLDYVLAILTSRLNGTPGNKGLLEEFFPLKPVISKGNSIYVDIKNSPLFLLYYIKMLKKIDNIMTNLPLTRELASSKLISTFRSITNEINKVYGKNKKLLPNNRFLDPKNNQELIAKAGIQKNILDVLVYIFGCEWVSASLDIRYTDIFSIVSNFILEKEKEELRHSLSRISKNYLFNALFILNYVAAGVILAKQEYPFFGLTALILLLQTIRQSELKYKERLIKIVEREEGGRLLQQTINRVYLGEPNTNNNPSNGKKQ